MSTSVKQLRKYNGVPQFASDPLKASIEGAGFLLFDATVQNYFLIEFSPHFTISTLLLDVQSAKHTTQEILRRNDSQFSKVATLASGDVTVLIDRMGNLVLAVQALFNQRCNKDGFVAIEAATGE